MKMASTIQRQCGATLVEVLVSLVASSVSLLGLAGLMATTVKVSQGAYQRTQAELAPQSLGWAFQP